MKKSFFKICFVGICLVLQLPGCRNAPEKTILISDGQVVPDFSWLNRVAQPRPEIIWENREDYIYHEMYYPDSAKLTSPECFAIMRCPWVFNRAMQWKRNADGTIIAYSEKGDLQLTGDKQVSAWYSEPRNKVYTDGAATVFEKESPIRQNDCAVLPSFQFHAGQHPEMELTVLESSDDWQFVVSIKGRSGKPFINSGWQNGAKTIRFNIDKELKDKGYDLNYPELHFVIGTWNEDETKHSRIKFQVRLIENPAVVGCLPVIRTQKQASAGISVTALLTGLNDDKGILVSATINDQTIALHKKDGIWQGTFSSLPAGSYMATISANQKDVSSSNLLVRVTNDSYFTYNRDKNYLECSGEIKKPVHGGFQGTPFFSGVGTPDEKMMLTQKDWDSQDRTKAPGEHQHYWESLTPKELNQRFAYLADNGWDMVFLHSHYGIWERFDVSGNLAPHGIEQFARYVDAAAKNNIVVEIALSSYPYSVGTRFWDEGTTPYLQTIEKGFKDDDWYNPENEPFRSIWKQYVTDFITTFKSETSILALSSSGEGDWKNKPVRFMETKRIIKETDTFHIILSEPIMGINKLPEKIITGFESDLVGDRNYGIGTTFNYEEEMGILFRLNRMVPNAYLAEGCYPSSNLYTKMTFSEGDHQRNCWIGTLDYRLNVRDALYLGLVNRQPILMLWDEVFTEDEHKILSEVRKLVDWNKPFRKPSVAVLINDHDAGNKIKIAKYERAFTRTGIDYRFISSKDQLLPDEFFIDNKVAFDSASFSDFAKLSAALKNQIPVKVSDGYSLTWCMTEDGTNMLAYVCNVSNHKTMQYYLSGKFLRDPQPLPCELTFLSVPEELNFRIYDLAGKNIVKEGKTRKDLIIKIDESKSDNLLVTFK
jgi:hypothetical protein